MAKQVDEKFSWVINNFSSLKSEIIYSDEFVAGGFKWCLMAFLKGNKNNDYLPLYLVIANAESLPFGRSVPTKFRLSVVNQHSEELSQVEETRHWFYEKDADWGFEKMILLDKLKVENGGFMVKNEVKIVAEVHVVGDLEATQSLKRRKLNGEDDGVADWVVDVNGFQVLSSQAESVKRIFEKHPDMTLEFQGKNQHLRTACMSVLLNLINTLCQSLQELSYDDLDGAESALTYVKDSGFKVDWLEKKLEEVKEKKLEEQIGELRVHRLEEELMEFRQKCSDKEVLLEKEKVDLKDFKKKCSGKEALLEREKEELKDFKKKCSDKGALLEKEKEELKDWKEKCLDTEDLLEKEKVKVLAAIAAPLTLNDVV